EGLRDPFEPRGDLPDPQVLASIYKRDPEVRAETQRWVEDSGAAQVRTALAVEPRDGILYVFMPPLANLDDYIELLAAVEASAAA
ncbi:transglutaminase family protein, partial [Mycobacterium tuberculosis]|nr:transglutaminase family protein [Mycobacterium tuberculosis]